MNQLPPISDAEWEVMKVLWRSGWASAAQIVEALAEDHAWHPRTIKTLLARLVRKGAAETCNEGYRYLYRARVPREAVVRQETKSFISRVFDGAAAPALVHFLKEATPRLSPEELAELRKILDEGAHS